MKILLAALLFFTVPAFSKTIKYELVISRGEVNLSGKQSVKFALMVNKSIPAPTLEFTEGDEAEIRVRNEIPKEEVSIHWHGILLPNIMDGVPYVTTPPIASGQEFIFRFKLRQSGTYWYHSHTDLQEQAGLYGAFIVHPKVPTVPARDVVVVLSDWTDEDPNDVLKNLKKDGDYYLTKKGTTRSLFGAIQARGFKTYMANEWTRMGGMDLSDIGYDAFLINGKINSHIAAKSGEKLRLRIINASASSYMYVAIGAEPMKVIAADGVDIEPVFAKEILMGMAETFDVLFEAQSNRSLELKATSQDILGSASLWIGDGTKFPAPEKPPVDLYAEMDHGQHGQHDSHSHSAHHKPSGPTAVETLTVDDLKAKSVTAFKKGPVHDLKLVLDGDMSRYIWFVNGKAIHEDRNIVIKPNDTVRFTFVNESMMHHPMHLHGHFFRVLNKHGDFSPLKHTVDVSPHSSRTIEFFANEPGEWMLHCHNLYHMHSGMARVVQYSGFVKSPEVAKHESHDPHLHDHWYFKGLAELATNHGQLHLTASQTWNQVDGHFELRQEHDSWNGEGDLLLRRWTSKYLNIAFGGSAFNKEYRAVAGVSYLLPLLIESTLLIDHLAKFRLELEKKFQWAQSIFTNIDLTLRQEHKTEFEISLMYSPSWHWAGGVMLLEDSVGAGIEYRF